jgi:hypothetical protein
MLSAQGAGMRNHKTPKYKPANLFCHREDKAFVLLDQLEGFFAEMVARPGSRYLRDRLRRASARLAEIVITASGDGHAEPLTATYGPAISLCKVVDGMLRLLRRYAVLTMTEYEEATKIATALMRVIARRYFGFDVADPDDGSSSGAPPSNAAPVAIGGAAGFGIAADGPPRVAADA